MILLISSKMHIKSGSQIKKVLVIGLGQLGLPVAKYVKESGFETFGYDINTLKMEEAEKNYGIKRIEQFDDIDVLDRKSTRLNSSHLVISYAVFCLKKKKP